MQWQIILWIIIIVLIITIAVSYYLLNKHKDKLENYRQRMIKLFENDLITMFDELGVKSYSGKTEEEYNVLLERYNNLQLNEFVTIENLIYETEKLINEWRFPQVNENEQLIDKLLTETEQTANTLSDDLAVFSGMGEWNIDLYNNLNTRYYEARKIILSNSFAFDGATVPLENDIKEIDKLLQDSLVFRQNGDLIAEQNILNELSERITKQEEYIEKIPNYIEIINENYANDLFDAENTYTEMINNNFVFDNDTISADISELNGIIQSTEQDFIDLNIESIETKMEKIDQGIDEVLEVLETEYYASKQADTYSKQLKDIFTYLYKQNRQIKIETDRFGQMFQLDDSVLSYGAKKEGDIRHLEGKFNEIAMKLQNNTISYSNVNAQAEDLIEKTQKIYEEQNIYMDGLYHLEDDVRQYRADAVQMNNSLKNIEQQVQRSNLPGFPDSFKELYSYTSKNLEHLIEELKRVRINFKYVDHYYDTVAESLSILQENIEDMNSDAAYTEDILRILQQYEQTDPSLKESIDYIVYYYETVNSYQQAYRLAYELLSEVDEEQARNYPTPEVKA